MEKIKAYLIAGLAIILCSSLLFSWYKPKAGSQGHYVEAPKEKSVEKIKTVTVPGPERIVTIEKEKVIDKLGLPESIKSDPDKQVIANADIPCDENIKGQSVVAILDTKTGESHIVAKPKPLSLIALESRKEIGIRYGIKSTGTPEIDLYGEYDFLRVGALHLGVYGEVNNEAEAKGMVQMRYRF